MTDIRIIDLTIRRGRSTVLDRLGCRAAAGQITGLLGPSGSGKTTLIRAIAGVQRISAGTVTVAGLAAGDPGLRGRLGYLTQAAAVYEDLTVTANVRYFGALAGVGRDAVRDVVAEVGLTGKKDTPVRQLSGGQRSRVGLACALIGDPAVLLLDEPTVGQDPVLREELWAGFHARAARGTTILVSSHVMDEAGRCQDLLLLRDGRLLAAGTPEEITARAGAPDMERAFLALVRDRDDPGDRGRLRNDHEAGARR